MKINAICPILGTSGYASHSRQLINALSKYHDIKISTMIPPGMELQLTDFELEAIEKPDEKDRINLIIDLPNNWLPHLKKDKNIGFLVFEGDRIPASWVHIIKDDRVNQVWVPSTHVLNAIKTSLIGNGEEFGYEEQQLLS